MAQTTFPWFRMWQYDFEQATTHLSAGEMGMYTRLLLRYYATGGALDNDPRKLQAIAGVRTDEEKKTVDKIVAEFFQLNGDGRLHQKRADRELEERAKERDSLRRRGREGAAARRAKNKPGLSRAKAGLKPGLSLAQAELKPSPVDLEVDLDLDLEEEKTLKSKHTDAAKNAASVSPAKKKAGDAEGELGLPPCPHDAIVGMWNERFKDKARVYHWNDNDRTQLRARWRWLLTDKRAKTGAPRISDVDSGLKWFEDFFDHVRASEFLSKWDALDLRWLVKAGNFDKVMGGKYHGGL